MRFRRADKNRDIVRSVGRHDVMISKRSVVVVQL